jgi:toxin FitB
LNEQVAETLYLTSVTLAEMLFGIAVLPASRRRNTLTRALDGLLELFGDRVLPFARHLQKFRWIQAANKPWPTLTRSRLKPCIRVPVISPAS